MSMVKKKLRKTRSFSMTDEEHNIIQECAAADGRMMTREVVYLARERLKQIKAKKGK